MLNFEEDVEILDYKRVPINSSERQKRLSGATKTYPYFGANGQVGLIDDFLLDGEYVLLGEDGAPFLDRYAEKAYIVSGKIWVNNHAHILKSKSDNKFLLHYLNWINYQPFVSGTTRLKLNQQMMKRIQIPDCPTHIKEKVVNLIDEAFLVLKKLTD